MIRDLLGGPDTTRPNPVFATGAPMALYLASRVEEIEAGEEFARRSEQASRRSATARETAARRRAAALEEIRAAPIGLPSLDRRRLALRAVEHRNRHVETVTLLGSGPAPETARLDDDLPAEVLHRWEVNYLRHVLTPYDRLLTGLFGRTGRVEAETLLRRRIYAAIAAHYPELAAECDRQLAERLPSG